MVLLIVTQAVTCVQPICKGENADVILGGASFALRVTEV